MPSHHRPLLLTSTLYLLNASTGARIAIDEDIPVIFLGHCSPNMPQEDFVRGFGTALSPGVKALAAQVALTALSAGRGPIGSLALRALALYGIAVTVGMLGERVTYVALHPKMFDPPKAIIIVANIILPLLMTLFALQELKRRRAA